ncbi:hypothetical protein QX204_34210 (plasmid) [Nocardia sp. PE-7]|uniref:hypothetical protein n=1 Tax=Nocardia sp. PE-7 TaxID=3058426 RepID=UPI002658B2A9|nr:hypothetical protein [Nocardia sp. PE-7]WKG13609.1 hypothetical protein QX204_34210 [Nocardia sp. PE-7]
MDAVTDERARRVFALATWGDTALDESEDFEVALAEVRRVMALARMAVAASADDAESLVAPELYPALALFLDATEHTPRLRSTVLEGAERIVRISAAKRQSATFAQYRRLLASEAQVAADFFSAPYLVDVAVQRVPRWSFRNFCRMYLRAAVYLDALRDWPSDVAAGRLSVTLDRPHRRELEARVFACAVTTLVFHPVLTLEFADAAGKIRRRVSAAGSDRQVPPGVVMPFLRYARTRIWRRGRGSP